jgi:hypothetical protein
VGGWVLGLWVGECLRVWVGECLGVWVGGWAVGWVGRWVGGCEAMGGASDLPLGPSSAGSTLNGAPEALM